MIVALLIVIIGAILWPHKTRFLLVLPFSATWWLITAPFKLARSLLISISGNHLKPRSETPIGGAWTIARYVLAAAPPVVLCFAVFVAFTSAHWDSAEHSFASIFMLALILPLPVFWSVRLAVWWWDRLGWEV